MNNYVVGFVSFHDNELLLEEIMAPNAFSAARVYLQDFSDWENINSTTLEELQDELFDGDCLISVISVGDNDSRAGRSGGGLQTRTARFDPAANFQ